MSLLGLMSHRRGFLCLLPAPAHTELYSLVFVRNGSKTCSRAKEVTVGGLLSSHHPSQGLHSPPHIKAKHREEQGPRCSSKGHSATPPHTRLPLRRKIQQKYHMLMHQVDLHISVSIHSRWDTAMCPPRQESQSVREERQRRKEEGQNHHQGRKKVKAMLAF